MSETSQTITLGLTRKSLHAIRIHACPHCQAPGLFKKDEYNKQHWPGCYDPTRFNEPVGDTCPNCQKKRNKDHDLGELCASMPKWIWLCVLGFKWCLIMGKRMFT